MRQSLPLHEARPLQCDTTLRVLAMLRSARPHGFERAENRPAGGVLAAATISRFAPVRRLIQPARFNSQRRRAVRRSTPVGLSPCASRRPLRGPIARSLRPRSSRGRSGRSTGRSWGPRPGECCGGCAFGTCGPRPRACAAAASRERIDRRRRTTSAASRVPDSYMQNTTPLSLSRSLSRRATRSIVCSSLLRPCRARKCGCSGRNTSSTAARALSVRMPSDGGQSMNT